MLKRHDNLYLGPLFTIITSQGQVTTTANHPFWVVEGLELEERPPCKKLAADEDQGLSLPGRWVASQHLQAGDLLYTAGGQTVRIEEIRQRFADREPICNLTVAENPTFSVGPAGLLVHNTSGCEEAAEGLGHAISSRTVRAAFSKLKVPNVKFKFGGARRIDSLRDATHADIVKAFEGTGLNPTGHFIRRIKDVRLERLGLYTFKDLEGIVRYGTPVFQDGGTVALVFGQMAIILAPIRKTLITIRPW